MTETALPQLSHARRVVIKIGSALIVDPQQAAPRQPWLDSVAQDIAALRAQGTEVVVVSSGAIALARHQLGLTRPVLRLEEKQAAASVGQIRLAQAWTDALSRFDITAAQLLLTPDDTENRHRYLNARASLNTLLALGCVPIINENDAIATTEIRFGDNDRLGARVAEMINADQLVLLSDIDGLYTADPRTNPDARHLPVIAELTASIEAMGGAPPPGYSSGGMRTKLMAARIATQAGCAMAIAKGEGLHPLARLRDGGRCTWFLPAADARSARKNWIAGSLTPAGEAVIDDGAVRALAGGSSLLPAGVTDVTGDFDRGDMIAVVDRSGQKIACGLAAYAADEARRIAGHQSDEIETLLGWQGADELIHRDDLVLLAKMESLMG